MHALTERLDQEDRAGCVVAKREHQSFSHFRVSKDTKRRPGVRGKKDIAGPYTCFSFGDAKNLPLLELCCLFDCSVVRSPFSNVMYKRVQ
jgi:hypothetical protein